MSWTKTQILGFAKEVKNNKGNNTVKYNDKKYRLSSVLYVICNYVIDTTKSSYSSASVDYPTQSYGDTVNFKVMKNDYLDMSKRYINYCNNHKKAPNYIIVQNKKINFNLFAFAIAKIVVYLFEHKAYPKYVEVNSKDIIVSKQTTKTNTASTSKTRFVSSPYLLDHNWIKQDYDASCALNSLQESFYKLTRKTVSESTMFNLGYTNSRSGTGHDGIKAIVNWFNKKYGTNISISFKNLSDFGKSSKEQWTEIGKLMSKSNVAVFFHIYYRNGGASCTSAITSQDHGHYEICDVVNVGTGYVRALNSLSGGYLQDRKISVQECFMKKISQPSVIILTKK